MNQDPRGKFEGNWHDYITPRIMKSSHLICTAEGGAASRIGLSGNPGMDERCIDLAHEAGINYFFFYNFSFTVVVSGLKKLLKRRRGDVIVATGSEDRDAGSLRRHLDKVRASLHVDVVDAYFLEYIEPGDDMQAVSGDGGLLDLLHAWKKEGLIRYAAASVHSRPLALELIACGKVDILMHRYNMAHRRSEQQVLPAALAAGVPVVAFTCTRWGSLLKGHREWEGPPPSAANCYQYALHHPAVQVALTSPATTAELEENLAVARDPQALSAQQIASWQAYGDLIYGDGQDAFETHWP